MLVFERAGQQRVLPEPQGLEVQLLQALEEFPQQWAEFLLELEAELEVELPVLVPRLVRLVQVYLRVPQRARPPAWEPLPALEPLLSWQAYPRRRGQFSLSPWACVARSRFLLPQVAWVQLPRLRLAWSFLSPFAGH